MPLSEISCSIGLGAFGIVFVNKDLFADPEIPEELKEFILAHEVAYIVRSHILLRVLIKFIGDVVLTKLLKKSLKLLEKAKDIVEGIFRFITTMATCVLIMEVAKIDSQTVKREELEADDIAIRLAGCKGAQIFANFLEWLQNRGFNISHESVLGFPALIRQKCGD